MVNETERYRIPLFDGTNFDNWKFRMETLLRELNLLSLVEKSYTDNISIEASDTSAFRVQKEKQLEELKKRDVKCCSQIIQRIADSHLEYVKDKSCAYEVWTSLLETFERKGVVSQLLIRKKLLQKKFNFKKKHCPRIS